MDTEKSPGGIKATSQPGTSAFSWASSSQRWIRRLAILQFLLLAVGFGWLGIALATCPQPHGFKSRETYEEVIELKNELIEDLRSKSAVARFRSTDLPLDDAGEPIDYDFIRMLVDWGEEDRGDSDEMKRLSQRIIEEYQREFAHYELDLKFLLSGCVAALFSTGLLIWIPRFSLATLMLLVSCSATPAVSELTLGRDLSEVFIYSLPFLLLSFAMFVLAFIGFWSDKFHRHPSTEEAWWQVGIGLVALIVGIALAALEIMEGSRLTYKVTQGLGSCIAAGLWCLFAGIGDLIKKRSMQQSGERRDKAPSNDSAK